MSEDQAAISAFDEAVRWIEMRERGREAFDTTLLSESIVEVANGESVG